MSEGLIADDGQDVSGTPVTGYDGYSNAAGEGMSPVSDSSLP